MSPSAAAPPADEVPDPSPSQALRRLALPMVVTRLGLIGAAVLGPLLVTRPAGRAEIGPPLLAMWARWDGPIYISIAQDGYFVREVAPVTAFFPLYPALMQLATLWSSSREVLALAGVVIANAALVAALLYLVALGRLDFDEAVGHRAALLYLVAPTTLFLSAVYTEALFLALFVASFYHARRGQFALSAGLGLLAALCRPYGILAALPLVVEELRRRRRPMWFSAPLLGAPLFFGWLWLEVGDPLAWFEAQRAFTRELSPPWQGFLPFLDGQFTVFGPREALTDLLAALLLVGLTALTVVRLPRVYGLTAATMTLLLLMTAQLTSMPRYALGVFPVFLLLGHVRGWRYRALVAASFAVALLAMARFAQWEWVA